MRKFKAKFKYDDDTIEISNEGSTVKFDSTWLEEELVLLPDEALEIAAALVSAANAAQKKGKMKTFNVTLHIESNGDPEVLDDFDKLADTLYSAGLDDALVYMEGGKYYVDIDREAESLGEAVSSAIRDVMKAHPDILVFRVFK